MNVAALFFALITFVPLDDRPVTQQLPAMLAAIAGERMQQPPGALIGNYLTFGKPDAITAWINSRKEMPGAIVASTDMLVYGGLVASRVPGVSYSDAYARLQEFDRLRARYPHAWIGAFGTIMRLAPTGIPALGDAAHFFAPYPAWSYLQQYANLHDPPLPTEALKAQQLAAQAGEATLQAYLQTRGRDYGVDNHLIDLTSAGAIDALVLGQDDAGPYGLHVKEVHALQEAASGDGDRVAIEPGADELGMAMVARALARSAHWNPAVAVHYSAPDGTSYNDPLEYAPIDVAIGSLVRLCGAHRVDDASQADIQLYVRVPDPTPAQDDALDAAMRADEDAGRSVAFADLTFLEDKFGDQAQFAERILGDGVAGRLDAYSSWNTNANTVGTAVAEAVAAGSGRRTHRYDALAHKEFTFNRIVDDYAFHDYVRPQVNRLLDAQGVQDHTYLLPPAAAAASAYTKAALWNRAAAILPQLYPGYHIAAMQITLPWKRTFEVRIDAAIARDL